jgi:zinc protease
MRRLVTLLISLLVVHAAFGAEVAAVKTPPYERIRLDNGAVLLLMERRDVPLITFNATLRGGAMTDPPNRSGLASLLAGMLEKGAAERDALKFAETVASVGGSIQTDAGVESVLVSGSFLARDQALMVELLADLLQRPRLERAEFESLRTRQIEFIRAAKESELQSLISIYAKAELFGSHPYGRSVSGSETELAAISYEDLQRGYQEQFGADRLIVAVAGDFKSAQMKQLLSQAFAKWRKAQAPLPPVPPPTRATGRRVLLVDAPDSVQSYFWAGNVGAARKDARRAPLDVVNTVFGGRFTSMLNSELRIRTGLSYGASSRFERLAQPGDWRMSSFTRTETTIEAIDLALSVLDKLQHGELDAAAIDSGKSYVLGQFPLGLETAGQWAAQLASFELYGLDRSYIDGYGAALAAVTLERARTAVHEVFPTGDNLVLVVIGKAAAIREGLRKYGTVTEMKLSDPTFVPPGRLAPRRSPSY